MRRFIAECILGVIITGLLANAWAVWNDVKELKVKEPITKEQFKSDIDELKNKIDRVEKQNDEIKMILIQREK